MSDKDLLFTGVYKNQPEIIAAAQLCGAKLTDGLFPRWLANKFYAEDAITVNNECVQTVVTVRYQGKEESMVCNVSGKIV